MTTSISRNSCAQHSTMHAFPKTIPGLSALFRVSVSHKAHSSAASASSVKTASIDPQSSVRANGNTSGRKDGISPCPMVSIPASAIRAKAIRMQPGTANRSSAFFPGIRMILAAIHTPRTNPRQPPEKDSSSHRSWNSVSADQFRMSIPIL